MVYKHIQFIQFRNALQDNRFALIKHTNDTTSAAYTSNLLYHTEKCIQC